MYPVLHDLHGIFSIIVGVSMPLQSGGVHVPGALQEKSPVCVCVCVRT